LPREQSVTKIEKREAMFQHIKSWQTGNKRMDNDYANSVAMWTLTPMSTAMAYLQVSHRRAKTENIRSIN
jgi:hypothetical protein